MSHQSRQYQVTRLVFDAGQPYEKFRGRYEAAVPPADLRPGDCAGLHVRWRDVAGYANGSSPHGFVLYWRADMTPKLTEAGELRPCTAYLMGHPVISEKAYLHDSGVMLYVPLRALIYIDSADRTRFAVDQPSTVYASFADPVITELGHDLDRQLVELLDALDVEAGSWMLQHAVGRLGPGDGCIRGDPGYHLNRWTPAHPPRREARIQATKGACDADWILGNPDGRPQPEAGGRRAPA